MDVLGMFEQVERATEERNGERQGDYRGNDGLLYCGRCHTPKQVRVSFLGQERTPFCLCECEQEKYRQEEERLKQIERMQRIQRMRNAGFPDAELKNWTFANDDGKSPQIIKVAENYVKHFDKMKSDGKGLLFYGDTGTGKSFAAACIVNALIDRGTPALMTDFRRLSNILFGLGKDKQEYLDRLNTDFPLLVIDDLATERKTEYMDEIVHNIIDCRSRSGLPLIVTTNLTNDELQNPDGMNKKRVYSRLMEMCIPIKVVGEDRRRKAGRSEYKEYKDLLGY